MSRRGQLGFVAACLLVFALIGVWVTRLTGLAVTDLRDVEQLQARFNADKGVPRLLLALAPT